MQLSALDELLLRAIGDHAVPAALGIARLLPCIAFLPFLSGGVAPSRLLRVILVLTIMIGIWPVTESLQRPADLLGLALAAAIEALIGTALGLTLALPFHVFHAVGSFVDTQRGAGVGAMLDPVGGVEATESATLLQMFSVVAFLVAGGLVPLLEVLQGSYQLVPMGTRFVPDLASTHAFVGVLLASALRIAGPVLLLLLLVEIVLGVLSRMAQQLNAFSVSLAVKSFIAFLGLLMYLPLTLTGQVPALWRLYPALRVLADGGTP